MFLSETCAENPVAAPWTLLTRSGAAAAVGSLLLSLRFGWYFHMVPPSVDVGKHINMIKKHNVSCHFFFAHLSSFEQNIIRLFRSVKDPNQH